MSNSPFNFYAPAQLPDGRLIYGVAAANWRVAQAGGFNALAVQLVMVGYQAATLNHQQQRTGN
ncbi:hypothetical protein ABFV51_04860 [Pseudomonas asgharzadehiana]|uniref:hypothetical protein n=1 Tax=Pseudomonas TaxID=286 RepID=UPI001BDEBE12|nr:hypothetical protein [Pseudomonas sp. VS38]MBT1269039.1 hypothetical protein [Pseudomonas sp. VS38]